MRRITFTASVVAVLAALALAPAGAAPPPAGPPILAVSGQATIDRPPDRATVTFGIVTNDDNATRAASANNAAYNALGAKLGALGLSGAAIKTTSYDLTFNPRPAQANPQFAQRFGYVVSREVSVTENRTDRVGALIDAGIGAGATSVGAVSFGLRDERAAYRAALAAAVADAGDQAHALAEAAHVRLGRIVAIEPAGGFTPIPRPIAFSRATAMAAPIPTDVQPSGLSVRASVTITYELAP